MWILRTFQSILDSMDYTDVMKLTALMLAPDIKTLIIAEVANFMQNEMQMSITIWNRVPKRWVGNDFFTVSLWSIIVILIQLQL